MRPKKIVTYSTNVFIPLTNICRNSCAYCGFRRNADDPEAYIIRPDLVREILLQGAAKGCTEALFTFGEHPEDVSGYPEQLHSMGFDSTIDYLRYLCQMALEIGLLPHSNPGVLSYGELESLKPLNASMGLMLETTAFLDAHYKSPGKEPAIRLETIEEAGRLKIPFTTGILVGIGETRQDRIISLTAISRLHQKYGHIQEVIIQNFTPKPGTAMADHPAPSMDEMIWTVEQARRILPSDIAVQVPPNLISPATLIWHGASDLGGISPETIDHINPQHKWPSIEELQQLVGEGIILRERLPIYPGYITKAWYHSNIAPLIRGLADEEGYRKKVQPGITRTVTL